MSLESPAAPQAASEMLAGLRAKIRALGSALVCFSGGIDSTLVLRVAHEQLGDRAVALTAHSPSVPERDRHAAAQIAHEIGADHRVVDSQELTRPDYVANGPDRCFHCKTELYELAESKRRQWGLNAILNGTNADDLGDHRPGLRAADNAGVQSPLVSLGMRKADVRAVARLLGLTAWDKPAAACLSSRIPYGTAVTPERLAQVEQLEAFLYSRGFRQLRVRWHENLARLEVAVNELPRLLDGPLREEIQAAGRRAGFQYVAVDISGYRQGSSNEVLARHLPVLSA